MPQFEEELYSSGYYEEEARLAEHERHDPAERTSHVVLEDWLNAMLRLRRQRQTAAAQLSQQSRQSTLTLRRRRNN